MPLSLEASSPNRESVDAVEADTVTLPRKIDTREASSLLQVLRDRRGAPLTIDAGCTEYVGGQCIALFISASKSWRADKKPLEFVNPSEDFLRDLALYGLNVDDLNVEDGR